MEISWGIFGIITHRLYKTMMGGYDIMYVWIQNSKKEINQWAGLKPVLRKGIVDIGKTKNYTKKLK